MVGKGDLLDVPDKDSVAWVHVHLVCNLIEKGLAPWQNGGKEERSQKHDTASHERGKKERHT